MTETTKMKVLAERLPTRCEVCHQKDKYDGETNTCSRCSETNVNQNTSYSDETPIPNFYRQSSRRNIKPVGQINRKFVLLASAVLGVLIYFSPGIYYVAKHGFHTDHSTNSINSEAAVEELRPPVDDSQLPVVQIPPQSVPYEVELSLNKPLENPSVVLAVNAVTVVDCEEPIVEIRTPDDDSIEVKQSTSFDKRFYLIGKYPSKSSNLVLISKNNVFNIYFQVRETADAGNFNVLVKVKK